MINFEKLRYDPKEKVKFYKSKYWRDLRKYVLIDNPLCEECKKNGILEPSIDCHHIIDIVQMPELALNNDNIKALCRSCHGKITEKTFKPVGLVNEKWRNNEK